jgi:hypothetical protein
MSSGYPDMKCMYVTIWVHHMQVDELFDFLTGRIDMPPPFWYNHEECPYTVTGGYAAINLPYEGFSSLRSVRDWEDPFSESRTNHYATFRDELSDTDWDVTLGDGLDDDWEDFVDER